MEFLTVQEASVILRISVSTLYKWSERGIVPSRKFGKRTLRFLASDLELFSRNELTGVTK